MKDEKIESIDQLKDSRAVSLAVRHRLKPTEIIPNYNALAKRVMDNGGVLKIDINAPTNGFEEIIRQIACGAVLCYELTQRESVRFPVANGDTDSAYVEFRRTSHSEIYENLGSFYKSKIDELLFAKR